MGDCNDPRIHTFGVMLEAMNRLNHVFDQSLKEKTGLSQAWFEALLRISRSGGFMPMGQLAEQVALTSGGITRMVDKLTEAGFAERQACETDRRIHYVAITEAGKAKLAEAVDVHLEDLTEELTSRLSDTERELLVDVMERLREPAPADIST